MCDSSRSFLVPFLVCLPLLTHCAHPGEPRPVAEAPVVPTDRGPVRGTALAGGGGSFLGIPYAAPPTGARRWRAPEPPEPWTGPLDATRLRKPCPQKDPFRGGEMELDEDCLHLNVWTPSLAPGARAPVMVFIHGGGFTFGSADTELFDGAALARAGVVVVVPNYRLGALGFLAHPALTAEDAAHHSSGNYGLLDQQRALQWVHDNIARFGGDPDRVTIFGESAGAVSVCLHLISPPSAGLFHRAIAESGTCYLIGVPLHDQGTPEEDSAEERGVRFARELGCGTGDVAACLRAKSPAELLAASGAPLDLLHAKVVLFAPNVDGYVVPAPPHTLLDQGRQARVPLLIGTNADEGTVFTLRMKLDDWTQYQEAIHARSPAHAEELLRIFPPSAFSSPRDAFNHGLRDLLFLCPTQRLMRTVAGQGQPVYEYQFTYAPPRGLLTWITHAGSFHAAELPFVFGATKGGLRLESDAERALSARMIGYWTRFAASGDPNGADAPAWPAYTRETEPYLVLDQTISRGEHLDQAHCDPLQAFEP